MIFGLPIFLYFLEFDIFTDFFVEFGIFTEQSCIQNFPEFLEFDNYPAFLRIRIFCNLRFSPQIFIEFGIFRIRILNFNLKYQIIIS